MFKSARLSDDGRYRYWLKRVWDDTPDARMVHWVMLNPSTADAREDDPTVRRVIAFSKAAKYSGCVVTNLFAYRATDPAELRRTVDPVGPENDAAVTRWALHCPLTIVAWGFGGRVYGRDRDVVSLLNKTVPFRVMSLGTTKDGDPRHPLYVRSSQQLSPYFGRERHASKPKR